jgi:enoyl-CoA hydratase/carnithine racemase
MTYDLPALQIAIADGVATVKLDNPPLNLTDATLLPSLRQFVTRVRHDADVRVVVFESADPEFFIAHGDMRFITEPEVMAAAGAAAIAANPDAAIPESLNLMQVVHEEVRALPQVTIAKLAGFARGGGTQYMTSLIGRARALELILGGQLVDAELAEKYGLVNRALPAGEIDAFVDTLAIRIARLRPEIIAAVKRAVTAAAAPVTLEGLVTENAALTSLFTAEAATLAHAQLAAGAQTRDGERILETLLRNI